MWRRNKDYNMISAFDVQIKSEQTDFWRVKWFQTKQK